MMKRIIVLLIIAFLVTSLIYPVLSRASLLDDLKQQIKEKEEEIKQLEEEAKKYQQDLQETRQKKATLQNQLYIIETRIKKLKTDIQVTSAKISSLNLQIEELNLEIYEKTKKIENYKKSIGGIIRTIYEYDTKTTLELMLETKQLSDFLSQLEYINQLQKTIQNDLTSLKKIKKTIKTDLTKLKKIKAALEEQKTELENKKRDLETYNAQLYTQKQLQDQQRSEKAYLLRQTRGEEQRYQQILAEIREKERKIQEEIFELEEKLRLTLDPESIPKPHSGILSWPNEGLLTQGYGYTPYSKRLYKSGFHNGIDIASGYGNPIKAAREGTIVAMGNTDLYCPGGAYGKWVAIEHDNNLTTLYAHLSAFGRFRVGDSVQRGEIIGYEGSSGYSTGSHLHFGVYASNTFTLKQSKYCGKLPIGATVNPLDYL